MRRTVLLAAFAVALILGAWLALRGTPAGPGPVVAMPDREKHATEPDGAGSLDPAAGRAAPRSVVEAPEVPTKPAETPAVIDRDGPKLIVSIVSKLDGAPLEKVRVRVRPLSSTISSSEDVAGTQGDMTHAPLSDAKGRVEIVVAANEGLEVNTTSENETCGWNTLEIPALGPSETREVAVQLACGDDLRYFGRIVDRETTLPVAGATVRLMRASGADSDGEGGWSSKARSTAEVHTDAAGRFDLSLASWVKPHLRIDADEYGPAVAVPMTGHERADHVQDLPISRAGTLRALVVDVAGKPIAGATLKLKAEGYELRVDGQGEEPGTWIDFPDERWSATLDVQGRGTIARLPARVPINLEIRQGAQLLRREADPLQLEPGQILQRTWTIGAGARVDGLMIDQLNAPVAHHEVWLQKREWPAEKYVDQFEGTKIAAKAASDARGHFVFEDVAPGWWWLSPAPTRGYADAAKADAVAPKTQSFEITAAATQTITLNVMRGLYVRGHVLDPEGKAVDQAYVGCTQVDSWVNGDTHTDAEGAFALGPLGSGTCTLWADGGGFASSDPMQAEPGQEGIVLRLRFGGKISGQVVDATTGKPCAANVQVTPEHLRNTPMGSGFSTETRDEGRFLLESLEPDRYQIVLATGDGRFATLSGIEVTAGQESSGHVASVTPGGKLSFRCDDKAPYANVTILHGAARVCFDKTVNAEIPVTQQVPAARITIEYTIGEKPARHTLSVDVAPGETREIVLKDDG